MVDCNVCFPERKRGDGRQFRVISLGTNYAQSKLYKRDLKRSLEDTGLHIVISAESEAFVGLEGMTTTYLYLRARVQLHKSIARIVKLKTVENGR